MTHALIVDAVRSPRGRGNDKGALKTVHPADLLAQQLKALARNNPFDTAQVTDTIVGCVTQRGDQGSNIARLSVLQAGWSDAVCGISINRYCASGLTAVHFAAQQALSNDGLAVGGGVEMMSRVPMGSDLGPLSNDAALQKHIGLISIGLAADVIASMEGFTREQCDGYALASQQRACHARDQGYFKGIHATVGPQGQVLLAQDETPRAQTTMAGLAGMPAAFAAIGGSDGTQATLCKQYTVPRIHPVHHAGNSPAMADGASAVLLASPQAARRLGLATRAKILAVANAGVDHTLALTGAVNATQKALIQAGLCVSDIDLFEVNESFAALMLHYMKYLDISHEKLNVNGGAIAMGHAMGSTGSTLVGMALDELERRDAHRAVIAICGATGVAVAMVIERVRQ